MEQTVVSSKYQVVIPKSVRERFQIKPGQRLAILAKAGSITLLPVPSLDEMIGSAKGINPEGLREEVDRL